MSEWSNEPVLKTGVLVRVPGVRIPLSPQTDLIQIFILIVDSVAQLVEQQTLNLWVQGSIPCWVTNRRRTRKTKKSLDLERCQSGRMSRS